VKHGHSWAWKALVTRYEKLVMSVAMKCGLSEADAEDCAQQSWIALYKNLDSIREPDRLGSWLAKTTNRNAIRTARRRVFRNECLKENHSIRSENGPSEQDINRLELHVHLEYAISQLDNRCQKLIRELFYSPKEDTYQEISNRLGISENSVGPIRHRCLKKLRHILKECGFL